jgi:hypothetical protein
MSDVAKEAKPLSGRVLVLAGAAATAAMVGGLWLAPAPANATPGYASQTKLSCGRCHVSAGGGGPRTAFGNAFAANGHKVPGKDKKKSGGKSSEAAPGAIPAAAPATPVFCGYYSTVCNPRYGEQPEFGYSNALTFKLYPQAH